MLNVILFGSVVFEIIYYYTLYFTTLGRQLQKLISTGGVHNKYLKKYKKEENKVYYYMYIRDRALFMAGVEAEEKE